MSEGNSIIILDWQIFEDLYRQHQDSSFLLELKAELDFDGGGGIQHDWFECLSLDHQFESEGLVGNVVEEIEAAKDTLLPSQVELLTRIMGIFNSELADSVNDLMLSESESWVCSSYNPDSVQATLGSIEQLRLDIYEYEFSEAVCIAFSEHIQSLADVFSQAESLRQGIIMTVE